MRYNTVCLANSFLRTMLNNIQKGKKNIKASDYCAHT